jgi:hypothetical protein
MNRPCQGNRIKENLNCNIELEQSPEPELRDLCPIGKEKRLKTNNDATLHAMIIRKSG